MRMLNIKRILAPVDLGPESEKVLGVAGDLAELLHSEVVALHVVQPVPLLPMSAQAPPGATAASFNVPAYQSLLEEEAEAGLEDLTERVMASDVNRALLVRTGRIVPTVLTECSQGDYDLVVMGSGETETELEIGLFGSVAESVVKRADVPVLVLKNENRTDEEKGGKEE
ncbi:hypothetical protein GF402_07995 [Candidatus Fermentibacteria bacterium]|nr:hypothetical protein [Candidatus Fermentibacteria bacterium]